MADGDENPVAVGRVGPAEGAHLAPPHAGHEEEQPGDHRVEPAALDGDLAGLDAINSRTWHAPLLIGTQADRSERAGFCALGVVVSEVLAVHRRALDRNRRRCAAHRHAVCPRTCMRRAGMRRVWVRGHENVRKRVLLQAAACNIGLLLRSQTGIGTPRSLQGRAVSAICRLIGRLIDRWGRLTRAWGSKWTPATLAGSIAHRQAD